MGMMMSIINNNDSYNNRIGSIPNTNLMYFTGSQGHVELFTKDLKLLHNKPLTINNINDMKVISQSLSLNSVIVMLNIHSDVNIDMSQYKLVDIYFDSTCQYSSWEFTNYIGFIIKVPTLDSIKCHKTYDIVFHKYKFIHTILCLDLTNIIFQMIMVIGIDKYYYDGLNKLQLNIVDDEFKRKFITVIHNNI